LSPIDTGIAHEAQQDFAAVFEGCEGDAGGLDLVESGGGEDGGADVPVGKKEGLDEMEVDRACGWEGTTNQGEIILTRLP
jgi:hypothetical protein